MSAVVFFDLDNTLIKGQTQRILIKYLRRLHKLPFYFYFAVLSWFFLYKLQLVRNTVSIRQRAFKHFSNIQVAEFDNLVMDFFKKEMQPRMFKGSLRLLKEHKSRGEEVVLVSASLSNIVDQFKNFLSITYAVSTELETHNRKFTGKIAGRVAYSENKLEKIKELVAKHDLDLKGSYAYTDHISDLPLLELVDNPRVVNPDLKLKNIAKERNWQIYYFNETVER